MRVNRILPVILATIGLVVVGAVASVTVMVARVVVDMPNWANRPVSAPVSQCDQPIVRLYKGQLPDGSPYMCDLQHPQRMDIVMVGGYSDDNVKACESMDGTPMPDGTADGLLCENVDY